VRIGVNKPLENLYLNIDLPMSSVQTFILDDIKVVFKFNTVNQNGRLLNYLEGEIEVIKQIKETISKDDVFYDVGAYYGGYSCVIGKSEPKAKIHAFEPGQERYNMLEEATNNNGVNVNCHNVGLGDSNKVVELTSKGVVTTSGGYESVKIVNGDEYIKRENIDPPTIMKIDVEGGELDVIKGMKNAISKHCEQIYCEVHTNKGVSIDDVENELNLMGFSSEIISKRGSCIHLVARQ